MKQFTVLIAIQLCLCVCIVAADKFCPPGFERIEGISKHRCFNHHKTTEKGIYTKVKFADALNICKGKNATMFEPKSFEEGDTIYKFVNEKRNGSPWSFWINYGDIQNTVSLVGVKVLLNSSYMGSLSTFDKMPIELWSDRWNKGGKRKEGRHCAYWWTDGVIDWYCSASNTLALVCETSAEYNLKQYLKFANEDVAAPVPEVVKDQLIEEVHQIELLSPIANQVNQDDNV